LIAICTGVPVGTTAIPGAPAPAPRERSSGIRRARRAPLTDNNPDRVLGTGWLNVAPSTLGARGASYVNAGAVRLSIDRGDRLVLGSSPRNQALTLRECLRC